MRISRFFKLLRRPRGNRAIAAPAQYTIPLAQIEYDPVLAQFESECG
ncbi:hypothetical protein [Sphingomonas sp. KR3-1]